jgi:hypothetical protein
MLEASDEQAHGGEWAAKLTRSEVDGFAMLRRFKEANDYDAATLSAWYMFPTLPDVGDELSIARWWSVGSDDDEIRVDVRVADSPQHRVILAIAGGEMFDQSTATIRAGEWFRIDFEVVQGIDGDGRIRLSQDGVELVSVEIATVLPSAGNTWAVVHAAGTGTLGAVLFVDDVEIAASL